jgi:hypothetical protein
MTWLLKENMEEGLFYGFAAKQPLFQPLNK